METIFTVHSKRIKLDSIAESINLYAFGDVHRDASGCDVDRWKRFLKKSSEDPDGWYICLGDTHDLASAREQEKLNRDTLHETTMETIDEIVEKRNRDFCKEIAHMRDRLLGIIDGNHNWRFPNGVTASEDLANRMGCDHLGYLSYYVITFEITTTKVQDVHIVACHGKAGGKRAGASINQVEDMKTIFPLADLYIMGHDHNRGAWPVSVLMGVNRHGKVKMKQKRQFLCRSGAFLKGYEEGKSNYVTGRLLRPTDMGALKLNIGFHRDLEDGDRLVTDIEATI